MAVISETVVASDSGRVTTVTYSRDGSLMATASTSGELGLWERVAAASQWKRSGPPLSLSAELPGKLGSPPPLTGDERLSTLAFAPPSVGRVLVCGTTRGALIVLEDVPAHADGDGGKGGWQVSTVLREGSEAIQALAFAPEEYGTRVAAGGGDGRVRLYEATGALHPSGWALANDFSLVDANWSPVPCTALSWRPHSTGLPPMLAAGGAAGASVWAYDGPSMQWCKLDIPLGGDGPVADVDWAPSMGRDFESIAIARGDRVEVYSLTGRIDGMTVKQIGSLPQGQPVWQVEWNLLGNVLAASCEASGALPPAVKLWRPSLVGAWALARAIVGEATPAM